MNTLRKKIRRIKKRILNEDTQTPFEQIKAHEYLLVSFPKSGRTWIRMMLNELGIEIAYTHDGSGHVPRVHVNRLIKNKQAYRHSKVIFLSRNPLDTLVSGFFHAVKRKMVFKGNIDEFMRSPRHGIRKIARFNTIWNQNRSAPKAFHHVRYEDLHKDTFGEMRKVLQFLDRESISDQQLQQTVAMYQFDNMQKMEREGRFKDSFGEGLTPKNVNDTDSYKTRRGKVGGYTDYLSEEQIKYCKSILQEENYPFEYETS